MISPADAARGFLVPASHVRTAETSHTTILIDYRTGAVAALSGNAAAVWRTCLRLRTNAPQQPGSSTTQAVLTVLFEQGWLVRTARIPPLTPPVVIEEQAASWGTRQFSVELAAAERSPARWRAAGLVAAAVTLAAACVGRRGRRFARLVALPRLGSSFRQASTGQIQHAIRAVRWAARWVPSRFACLEESVSAAVLLAALRRRATWCHGIATDPIRLHAWLAGPDGEPVEEPDETARYTVITRYPAVDRNGGRP